MRRANLRSFSQGFPQNIPIKPPEPAPTPLNIEDEYTKLKTFLKDQKQLQEAEWQRDLPYKVGYFIILMIVVAFFLNGIYSSYSASHQKKMELNQKIEQCMVKYQQKKCTLDKLDGDCRSLWSCMRERESQFGTIQFITHMLSTTVGMITQNILGPIMLAILASLMKIVQVISSERAKQKKTK